MPYIIFSLISLYLKKTPDVSENFYNFFLNGRIHEPKKYIIYNLQELLKRTERDYLWSMEPVVCLPQIPLKYSVDSLYI